MVEPTRRNRTAVARAELVVVKVGTRILAHADGHLALTHLFGVVEQVGRAHREGKRVMLVTSGAVRLGAAALRLDTLVPSDLARLQMCAAIGQSRLMALYQSGFAQMSVVTGQVLLTPEDFDSPERFANLNRALHAMLEARVIPIVNSNDVVGVDELGLEDSSESAFVENDRLAALVAAGLPADLLVLLTNVDGVYDKDPNASQDAVLVPRLDEQARVVATHEGLEGGKGGMFSKLQAARVASSRGTHVVIANGLKPGELSAVLAGDEVGTWLHPPPD